MTVYRWKHDPSLGTPEPMIINDIEYNDLDAWDAWLKARAVSRVQRDTEPPTSPPPPPPRITLAGSREAEKTPGVKEPHHQHKLRRARHD
jgi:hypothetical protein